MDAQNIVSKIEIASTSAILAPFMGNAGEIDRLEMPNEIGGYRESLVLTESERIGLQSLRYTFEV